jgi:hypothetical protein
MLIDREKMLVLPFRKTRARVGLIGLPIFNLGHWDRKSSKQ